MLPYIQTKNKRSNILIIDDDPPARKLLRIYLEEIGFDVVEAEDGSMGFELYKNNDYDFVLIDCMMPVMDGISCVKEMKKISKNTYVPIIFLTANDDPKIIEECIAVGGDDLIIKPFDVVNLRLKLHSWLRMKVTFDQLSDTKNKLFKIGMQNELDLQDAKEIIEHFNRYDQEKNNNIKHVNYPANKVSGDIFLISNTPIGNQYALLGDFTGHGLPAGIGTMLVSQTFYTMTEKGFSIKEIADEINKKLIEILPVNRFLAACFIELNYSESYCAVLNAGIPDVQVFNQDGENINSIKSNNLPFGIKNNIDSDYEIENFKINYGERIIAFSDGLIEASNSSSEHFGISNLLKTVSNNTSQDTMFASILNAFNEFKGDNEAHDDVSLLEITVRNQENQTNTEKTAICNRTPSIWNLSVEFDESIIRETDPVPSLVNHLIAIQGVKLSREKLYLILNELYSNSLEHGILGLDSELKTDPDGFDAYYKEREKRLNELESASIKMSFQHEPTDMGGKLEIIVTDSGSGFDINTISNTYEENLEYKGRGIRLIKSLSDYCQYQEGGKQANVHISWEDAA